MNRLHPRVRLVWAVRSLITAAILGGLVGGATLVFSIPRWSSVAVFAAVALLGVTFAVLRYRRWRYEIRDDAVYLERGVLTQVRTVIPLVRIQHVDSRRNPLERLTGLASVVVYTAGSRGVDVQIPGITPASADELRERLKRLAIRAEGEDAV